MYEKELSIPLYDMEETYIELKVFDMNKNRFDIIYFKNKSY